MLHVFGGLVSLFSGKHPKWVRYERAAHSNVGDSPVVKQSTPFALIDLLENWISPAICQTTRVGSVFSV